MPLHKLRVETQDQATASRVADRIGAPPAPEALAVTLFELAPPAFVVEAYYDQAPSARRRSRKPLAGHDAGLGRPALETVPDTNWVALSQAALPPIRAGTVHRARQP